MKKVFGPGWTGAWLASILPDSLNVLGKKTPWYRQSWVRNVPWLAVALSSPFAVFLIWKIVSLAVPKGERGTEAPQPQPPSIELT